MENQITLNEWMEWKEDIRRKLQETAENFVYIGYRLKQIRDSGMLDGAADIFEFAQREYGLGKSTTSRFIAINEKYSEGGNSLELREEFRGFSSSKLSEMLTLPDNECQLITERTTIKEIRELKNFSKEQVQQDGMENEEVIYTPLQKCIIDFFKDPQKAEMLNEVMENLALQFPRFQEAAELMNPSGQSSHKKGIIFLFMYDYSTGVKYKDLTLPEPVSMSWNEFLEKVYEIYCGYECIDKTVHEAFYGKIEEEKEPEKVVEIEEQKSQETEQNQGFEGSVATSQQEEKTEEFMPVPEEEDEGEKSGETDRDTEVVGGLREEDSENNSSADINEGSGASVEKVECESGYEDGQNGCDAICNPGERNGEEEEHRSSEPHVTSRNRENASKIEKDVRERADGLFWLIKEAKTTADWRDIRHKLNNLSCDIESLMRYLEAAEDEESEE